MMESKKDRVKFNVSGRIFETTATTLAGAGRNSLFGAMFDDDWNLHSDAEHFIDRDPDCFTVLLNLLRTGELHIPPNIHERFLYREALYYGVLDHVRSAIRGTIDGNRLRLARSISTRSIRCRYREDTRFIRPSSSGGCCVPYCNTMVKVYDWMLEEHPIINLHDWVNDACWVDYENIVISCNKNLESGGIGLFNASTGKLRYNFQVTEENRLKGYKASALGVNSDYKMFSICENSSKEDHGIGVWDQVTGEQLNFFHMAPYWPLTYAYGSKLQWLHGTNCLMVASLYPIYHINLLDLRENNVVRSWPDTKDQGFITEETNFTDAIAIEDRSSICVVDDQECLGFIDLRSISRDVNWREGRDSLTKKAYRPCLPKLAFHEGQLFSSMKDTVSVYCGSNWTLTSQFRQSHNGSICDFSISGDRLFALDEEDVFDVWETPRPPII